MAETSRAILRIFDGTNEVDLLGPGSGWRLSDPSWSPQVAQPKGGGHFVDAALAEGRRIVFRKPGNVIETIPLAVFGKDQNRAVQTMRAALQILRQGADYWTEDYEYDDIWLEARPGCNDCLTGYTRIIQGQILELGPPFRQPFFTDRWPFATMENITLILEREPFWRATPPGTIIGPLYNLLRNPDFELWTQPPGIVDSEPDSWENIETLWITGTNNRQDESVRWGDHALRVEVRSSTLAGAAKGVTQTISSTQDQTTYTIIAWVRSDGISNGVGRILVTYSDQFELYRSDERHGWILYVRTFTTGVGDVVAVHCEILTTAANTDGTVYFDGLMLLEGDWQEEAENNTLPYISSSHISNHWDQPEGATVDAGDINWVDVWNIPGDVDSLIRLEFTNNTDPADQDDPVEVVEAIRIGLRRTRNVFNFDNFHDPPGIIDATSSSGDYVGIAPIPIDWQTVTTKLVSENTLDNLGRFRVLARVFDDRGVAGDATLQARLRYFTGTAGVNEKILTGVPALEINTWSILDLTPRQAMIQEEKFAQDPPGQWGYSIQMRGAAEGNELRFDYSMVMPTDGGYLEATITPPLTFGNALVVDNTSSPSIKATSRRAGLKPIWRSPAVAWTTGPAIVYRGRAYFAVRTVAPANQVRIWDEITFETINAPELFLSFGTFNDELYAGDLAIYRFNGTDSWSEVFDPPGAGSTFALRAFDGYLYATNGNSIYRSADGDAWNSVYTYGGATFGPLEVYNNRLYAGERTANRVHVFDGAAWSLLGGTADLVGIRTLKSFDGLLWLGGNGGSEVNYWDGSTFFADTGWPAALMDRCEKLEVFEGSLYGGSADSTGIESRVLARSADGSWSEVLSRADDVGQVTGMTVLSGSLYVLATGNAAQFAGIYAYASTDNWYKVPNFQGGLFVAPSRKIPADSRRHRWFFSYDRTDKVNDIDDQALIGIGFVPRYYSLRGAD